jgi:hypothetical protein
MDPLLSGLVVRFLERITAVLIGGMALYLGFRLFREVPEHRDSSGNLVLPWDISIKLTRVGPGVLFALFGIAAVSLALFRPLEIQPQASAKTDDPKGAGRLIYGSATPANRDARSDGRKLLQKHFAVLNTIPSQLRPDIAKQDADNINVNLREIKLKLMRPVWGDADEDFGDYEVFEHWVRNGESPPPPPGMKEAVAFFNHK